MDGLKLSPLLAFICLAYLTASGCGSPVQSEKVDPPPFTIPSGTGDPYNPVPGADPTDAAGFFVKVASDSAEVTTHRSDTAYGGDPGTGNFTTECRIAEGTSLAADKDILCIAEIEELDAFFSELSIQYHFPPSMCSYAKFKPYYFYDLEPGVGETNLTVTLDVDGTVLARSAGVDATGARECDYDYSSSGGPNCCMGSWTMITTQKNTPDPDSTSTASGEWGGAASSCMAGPGKSDSSYGGYISADGYPLTKVAYVEGTGLNETFTVPAPIKSTFNGYYVNSNLWTANYYKVSDHSGQSIGVLPADRPLALRYPATLPQSAPYLPSDTYKFECHNRAEEIQYRIRLMIREWNTHEISQGGDPEVNVGTDPDFPDGPINDRMDWFDLGNAYPGASL